MKNWFYFNANVKDLRLFWLVLQLSCLEVFRFLPERRKNDFFFRWKFDKIFFCFLLEDFSRFQVEPVSLDPEIVRLNLHQQKPSPFSTDRPNRKMFENLLFQQERCSINFSINFFPKKLKAVLRSSAIEPSIRYNQKSRPLKYTFPRKYSFLSFEARPNNLRKQNIYLLLLNKFNILRQCSRMSLFLTVDSRFYKFYFIFFTLDHLIDNSIRNDRTNRNSLLNHFSLLKERRRSIVF